MKSGCYADSGNHRKTHTKLTRSMGQYGNLIPENDQHPQNCSFWWSEILTSPASQPLICSSTRLSHQRFILERAEPKGACHGHGCHGFVRATIPNLAGLFIIIALDTNDAHSLRHDSSCQEHSIPQIHPDSLTGKIKIFGDLGGGLPENPTFTSMISH